MSRRPSASSSTSGLDESVGRNGGKLEQPLQAWVARHHLHNVDPGLINPWLILRGGCPLLVGIQTTFGGNTPLIMGRVY